MLAVLWLLRLAHIGGYVTSTINQPNQATDALQIRLIIVHIRELQASPCKGRIGAPMTDSRLRRTSPKF
ncbi:hypothetical protein M758_7G142500 [Ceratodon purpureus]|uniref:Secreted protein n=1 Tax=Ceratodon purpureus TaxID=3225 RepID=A0A8T0H7T2_CERPU|nr:hypothetical protein KC19_7G135700 [Ceratodon purpureus]KAG0611454.1 hypothetical protein M758_7G142500 [Ceratodon purpureus]